MRTRLAPRNFATSRGTRIARERVPFFAIKKQFENAFAIAEREGKFKVDEASAVKVAPQIRIFVRTVFGWLKCKAGWIGNYGTTTSPWPRAVF